MRIFLRLSAVLVFLVLFAGQALAAPIGQVTALVPGVFVDRGGQEIALALKDSIEAQDTLRTDASGKVQILFADNSSVTLGSNTTMTMEEFAFEGSEPEFKANLGQGLMRVITGAIVEQNPEGFGVTTPEANIGIRGTIFTAQSKDDHTTVWVENTTKTVSVNGIDVPAGQKITVPGTPAQLLPITNEDREYILDETTLHAARGGYWIVERRVPPTDLSDVPLVSQTMGDNLYAGGSPTPTPPPPVINLATISGSLSHGSSLFWNPAALNGNFTAKFDLATGNMTAFNLSGSGTASEGNPFTYTANGGTGSVGTSGMNIAGFTGLITTPVAGQQLDGEAIVSTSNMYSTPLGSPVNISTVGNTVFGSYTINTTSGDLSYGTFNGSRTK